MSKATNAISAAPQWVEVLSPELALVDSTLAEQARAYLPEVLWMHAPEVGAADSGAARPDERSAFVAPTPWRLTEPDTRLGSDDAERARRRLLEAAIHSDVEASVVPSGKRSRRRSTLIVASSAAASAAIVLQGMLSQGMPG
jgi:hypothetical protein